MPLETRVIKANECDKRVKNQAYSGWNNHVFTDVHLETTKSVKKTSEGEIITYSPVELVAKNIEQNAPLRQELLSHEQIIGTLGDGIKNISLFVDGDRMFRIAYEEDDRRYERDYFSVYKQHRKQVDERSRN